MHLFNFIYTFMKKVIIAIAFVFGFLGISLFVSSNKVSAANVTVTSPTSGGGYNQIPISLSMSAPVVSNSITFTFAQVPLGTTYSFTIDPLSNPLSTPINPRNVYSNVNVTSASATVIPDDFYNLT